MTFDVRAAKDNLILLLTGMTGVQAVLDGAPESMPAQATVWVDIGDLVDPPAGQTAGRRFQLRINLIATLGFVVETNEALAADSVADFVANVIRRVGQNRESTVSGVTSMLNGSVQTMELPKAAAMPSDYLMVAGQETRVYPVAIEIVQYESIPSP